jgi:hypothetical protein
VKTAPDFEHLQVETGEPIHSKCTRLHDKVARSKLKKLGVAQMSMGVSRIESHAKAEIFIWQN